MNRILKTLSEMESGECRWVESPAVHAYCRAPMINGFRIRTYRIVTDAREYLGQPWIDADDAAETVKTLTGETR